MMVMTRRHAEHNVLFQKETSQRHIKSYIVSRYHTAAFLTFPTRHHTHNTIWRNVSPRLFQM